MSTVLQPFINDLNSATELLQVDTRGLLAEVSDTGVALVMGPALLAGKRLREPGDVLNRIKAVAALSGDRIEAGQMVKARKEIRALMDEHADYTARAAVVAAHDMMLSNHLAPALTRSQSILDELEEIRAKAAELVKATSRIPGAGKMSAKRKESIHDFEESQKFVAAIAQRKRLTLDRIEFFSAEIHKVMFEDGSGQPSGSGHGKELKEFQEARDSLEKENVYLEKALHNHFRPGSMNKKSEYRASETPFKFPADIEKGRGADFCKSTLAALQSAIQDFWFIMPVIKRATSDYDPITNTYFKPPSKHDAYAAVNSDDRELYDQQARTCWERLASVVPQSVITKVRSTFRYGKKEEEFQCAEGDGPSLIFSIVALFRPCGDAYRDSVENKIYASAERLKSGVDPKTWVLEMRPLLQECLELDIKLKWSLSGKRIVLLMTDKCNTFSQKLSKFANSSAVADPDDSGVELDQVMSLIEAGCEDIENSGMRVTIKANQIQVETGCKPCSFGMECFRRNCSYGHPH